MGLFFCFVVIFAMLGVVISTTNYLSLHDDEFVHMGTIDEFARKMEVLEEMQGDDRRGRRSFMMNNLPEDRVRGGPPQFFERGDVKSRLNKFQPGMPDRNEVQSQSQLQHNEVKIDDIEPKYEWGQKAHADIQHEVVFYLTNPHKAFIEERLRQNPNDPIFSKASMRDRYPPMSRNAAAEQKVDEFLSQIGASVFDRNIATISATAPIHVWEKALRTEFFQLHTNIGERPVVHRAKSYSLPKDVAPHVAIVSGVAEYPAKNKLSSPFDKLSQEPSFTMPRTQGAIDNQEI
jgi:hypothetical protein